MKPFDENDLIAYHMHELSPRRARALERALQTDAALAAEFKAYATMLQGFRHEEPLHVEDEALERAWLAVRPSLTVHQVPAGMRLRWHAPALAGGGIAFAGTLAFVGMHHHKAAPVRSPASTAVVGRPSDVGRPVQPAEEALRTEATPGDGLVGTERQERRKAPWVGDAPQGVHKATRPRVSYLSLARTPGQAPEFIPLAVSPIPVLPPQTPIPGIVVPGVPAPEGDLQGVVEEAGRSKRRHPLPHHEHPTDLTFAMGGTLIGTRQGSSSGALENFQGASRAVSAVAAFHQQLRPAVGYRLTFSYTRPEFIFTTRNATLSYGTTHVNSRVFELAGTYVVRGPQRGRVSTFAEAGAGLMSFLPTVAEVNTHSNLRGAAVFGIGAEVALTKRLALHAAYRGQVFQGPDFKADGPVGPYVTSTLFSNEPTVGITYRFVHK